VSRRRDQRLADVVIELDDPAKLFAVDARGLLDGSRRIDSGIDELIERLLAQRRLRSDQSIVLDIAGGCPDELAANLVESVRRYGEMAVRRANRQRDLIWRQGMRSLVSGSLLFGTGIALSYLFTRPMVGEFAGDLFGNGVFLVVAWVGLWYPIDVLFIAREQAKREARVLHLSDDQHDLHVRPGGGGTARAKPDVCVVPRTIAAECGVLASVREFDARSARGTAAQGGAQSGRSAGVPDIPADVYYLQQLLSERSHQLVSAVKLYGAD